MAQGWIKLHREIQSHWVWADKPFSKGQAWIDILLLANRQDKKILVGNELVNVKMGSFITSELKLMERWGWSKRNVRNFLKMLETDKMIKKVSNSKRTTIYVEKYNDWQDTRTASEPQTDCERTANGLQADTNKKDKERKERKEELYKCIRNLYNDICHSLPPIRVMSEARKKAINARLNTYGIEDFETAFKKAEASSFLKGVNSKNWTATFDWIIKDANMAKVIDGNYDNRSTSTGSDMTDLDEFF